MSISTPFWDIAQLSMYILINLDFNSVACIFGLLLKLTQQ